MGIIGGLEFAAAIGLILPGVTGIQPWLTPLAAAMLAFLMSCAAIYHVPRREWPNIGGNVFLGVLAAVLVYGRFIVEPLG